MLLKLKVGKKDEYPKVVLENPDVEKYATWSVSTERERTSDLSELIEHLIDMFKGKEHLIKKICGEQNLKAAINIYNHPVLYDQPAYIISKKVLDFTHSAGIYEITMDQYIYGREDDEIESFDGVK